MDLQSFAFVSIEALLPFAFVKRLKPIHPPHLSLCWTSCTSYPLSPCSILNTLLYLHHTHPSPSHSIAPTKPASTPNTFKRKPHENPTTTVPKNPVQVTLTENQLYTLRLKNHRSIQLPMLLRLYPPNRSKRDLRDCISFDRLRSLCEKMGIECFLCGYRFGIYGVGRI